MEENRNNVGKDPSSEMRVDARDKAIHPLPETKPNPPPPTLMTWKLIVEVSGGEGPYRVSILDDQGRTVSQARLKQAGQFPLNIRSDVSAVSAVLEDSAGGRIEVDATPQSPKARLSLGD